MEEEKNPWKTLNSTTKYENPWIRVDEHQVINVSNNEGIYGTVHFKNLAVGVIPLDVDDHIFLVGQYRYPLNAYSWEIPEGGGALSTDPLETAKRELKEETGLSASNWQKILEMHLSNSVSDERAIVYLARDLTPGKATPEEDESIVVKKVPIETAHGMVLRGEITDAISVAAILHIAALNKAS